MSEDKVRSIRFHHYVVDKCKYCGAGSDVNGDCTVDGAFQSGRLRTLQDIRRALWDFIGEYGRAIYREDIETIAGIAVAYSPEGMLVQLEEMRDSQR